MNLDGLFRQEVFAKLDPRQLVVIKQFARELPGKTGAEIAKLYMQLNHQLSKIKPLSPIERKSIVEAVKNFLPEKERQKIGGYLKMLRL